LDSIFDRHCFASSLNTGKLEAANPVQCLPWTIDVNPALKRL